MHAVNNQDIKNNQQINQWKKNRENIEKKKNLRFFSNFWFNFENKFV